MAPATGSTTQGPLQTVLAHLANTAESAEAFYAFEIINPTTILASIWKPNTTQKWLVVLTLDPTGQNVLGYQKYCKTPPKPLPPPLPLDFKSVYGFGATHPLTST
jgi:hypothetical protein